MNMLLLEKKLNTRFCLNLKFLQFSIFFLISYENILSLLQRLPLKRVDPISLNHDFTTQILFFVVLSVTLMKIEISSAIDIIKLLIITFITANWFLIRLNEFY